MRRLVLFLALGLAFSLDGRAFERSDWLADFEQVKTALTVNYPNLEWAIERGLDLAAVERRARDRLAAATTDFEARSALERFVANFGDGHLSLTWPAPKPSVHDDPKPAITCKTLGYDDSADTRAIAKNLDGYQALPAAKGVDAGTVIVAGKQVAVLRIPLFNPSVAMCEAVSQEILRGKTSCDEACETDIQRRSDNFFLQAIEDRLEELKARHPDVLLVDLAGNGGGNDTAIALARMLTDRHLLTPSLAYVRSPSRSQQLTEDTATLEAASHGAKESEAAFLKPLLAGLADATRQANQSCDLTNVWNGKPAGCTNLIRGPFFAGGMVAEEIPEAFRAKPWASIASWTAQYRYTDALWKGPLMLLVDAGSASATELLAAMLQDAGSATVIGAPTFGAGCGWTLSDRPTELAKSGGLLHIPDCARFRRDGRNEIDGIQPDELVGFRRYDSPKQQAERLMQKLPAAVLRIARPRSR